MMAALSRWRDTNAPPGGVISEQPITVQLHIAHTQHQIKSTEYSTLLRRLHCAHLRNVFRNKKLMVPSAS